MDDLNITMEEYIRIEEVFNWETAKYGMIRIDEDIHNLISVKTKFPAITLINEISYKKHFLVNPRCFDDLDFFNDLENKFPAIVYNDALTSKLDLSNEPTLCPQHIDDFDLKYETSLSEYDEKEQNIFYFNDLFPFNIIQLDDLKSEKDNDNNEIDIIQSSGGNESTNKLLDESHDKINKVFIMKSFVMGLNVNIVTWNHFINGMLFNLIKDLYVPFGIPFDPKWYYKDGDCARMLRRPSVSIYEYAVSTLKTECLKFYNLCTILVDFTDMALSARDQRHLYLRMLMEHHDDGGIILLTSQAWERVFETRGLLVRELILEFLSTLRFGESESERMILGKGDLHDYWRDISTDGDLLGPPPSYTLIRDPVPRLCHRMMVHSIVSRSQAPEKVTVTDLFFLRGLDVGSVNIPYLLARYLRRFATGRNNGALISGGQFVDRLSKHFRLLTEERLRGLTVTAPTLPVIDMAELVRLQVCEEIDDTWAWVALGPERHPDAATCALRAAEDASVVDEGDQAVLAPVQAPPLPPAVARTMPPRIAILEEDVYKIHGALA
ncbi:hypothetical protein Tco_1260655, partial [Tanacetum coccineum]